MRTELILGTLDQCFDRQLNSYIESVENGREPALLADEENKLIHANVFFISSSFVDLLNPVYFFCASRELLDDTRNRFPKIQHRHLIPYIPVTNKGKIALYARTPKGTESELHGKLSIGFGGHIEAVDCAYFGAKLLAEASIYQKDTIDMVSTLTSSILRELEEEFNLREGNIDTELVSEKFSYDEEMAKQYGTRKHAIIVSNDSDVDRRHLALLYRVEVKDTSELIIEDQLNFIGWFTQQQIKEHYFEDLEMWSKAIISLQDINRIPSLF